jgi:hypothetical protein
VKRAAWILAAAVVFVVVVGLSAWWVKGHAFSCGGEAAEILHSLPGAAGRDVGRDVSGDCHLEYETSQPQEEFISALAAFLESRGWKVTSEREIPTNVVSARRGPWQISVGYQGDNEPLPGGAVPVEASVYEVEG